MIPIRRLIFVLSMATQESLISQAYIVQAESSRPNIVHIFVDDLGYGSTGFTGQQLIQTPNLDALAAGGMVFNNAYASTVCAPSRANLYTGFHNGHARLDRNGNIGQGFRAEDVTVGEVVHEAGYRTGFFGKWGFGGGQGNTGQELYSNANVTVPESLPNQQGFDEFYGYLNHSRAHSYWNDSLWTTAMPSPDDGDGIRELGEQYYATPQSGLWMESTGNNAGSVHNNFTHDIIGRRSEAFVRDHAGDLDPFLLQVSYTIPHFDIDDVVNAGPQFDLDGNVISPGGVGQYAGQFNSDKQRRYAANITRMDDSVGALINRLRDPNGDQDESDSILHNTIVFFTSDNGGTNADGAPVGFFDANADFIGGKRDLYEGGIHVPGFAYWVDENDQSQLAASSTELRTDLSDFLATAADFAGVDAPVGLDGVSLVPTLTGHGVQRQRDYLIFEAHENSDFGFNSAKWTVIRDDMKLIRFDNGNNELFDLSIDPNESTNIAAGNATIVAELEAIAVAEGVEQPDSYGVEYMTWSGVDGAVVNQSVHWSGSTIGAPADSWSATIGNVTGNNRIAETLVDDLQVLGLDVRGDLGTQTLRANRGVTISGRNEVRINAGGRIQLDDGRLISNRWIDLKAGGQLTGHGVMQGDLVNAGKISPGLPTDLNQPIEQPTPPQGVDTGVVPAVVFDFTGLQDGMSNGFVGTNNGVSLTQTSTLNEWVTLTQGLSFNGVTKPRHSIKPGSTDAGDELNVQGWGTGVSLTSAINGDRFVSFAVEPVFGIEMLVESVSFNIWRNGTNAPQDYAIMASLDGFASGDELGAFGSFNDDGVTNDHLLTAFYTGNAWTTEEVEFRLYGWNANNTNANTHINGASLSASFRTLADSGGDDVALDPTGILSLNGNFWHVDGATIEIDLGGTDNSDLLDPQYDAIAVSGTADLEGGLVVSLADEGSGMFQPKFGDSFEILTATAGVTGKFSLIVLPSLPDLLVWDVVYGSQSVHLAVRAAADFDADQDVDADDLTIWQSSFAIDDAADANGDGASDGVDFLIWQQSTGLQADSQVSAVPEPTTLFEALFVGFFGIAKYRLRLVRFFC